MTEFEKSLKAVREVFVGYPKRYKDNLEYLEHLQREESDILHLLELAKINAYEGYKFSKRLQEIRQERRKIKNENEYLKVVLKLIKKSSVNENRVNDTIGKIRILNNTQKNRRYNMRVRKDLQEFMDSRLINK